jgi:hypothetical protein
MNASAPITRAAALLCFSALLALHPDTSIAQTGWCATVKSDAVPVYSSMSSSSPVVKSLHEGDPVFIDLDLATGQGHWCGIREAGAAIRTSYVLCGTLEREKTIQSGSVAPLSKELAAECRPLINQALELSALKPR